MTIVAGRPPHAKNGVSRIRVEDSAPSKKIFAAPRSMVALTTNHYHCLASSSAQDSVDFSLGRVQMLQTCDAGLGVKGRTRATISSAKVVH